MHSALIVDDHPFIRSTVRFLLAEAGIAVVAETDNGVDAVQLAREHRPALIVLDIALPRLDGLNVVRRLSLSNLPTRILILTSQSANIYARRCRRVGAHGYLCKSEEIAELGTACATVLEGGLYFPSINLQAAPLDPLTAVDELQEAVAPNEMQQLAVLSNREVIVLHALAMGRSNKQIGEQLIISAKTVSTYKSRLMHKLKLASVVQLAEFARRTQLTES